MKIENIATPTLNSIPNAQAVPQISARDKAVQAFMKSTTQAQTAQEHPVQNPSQVSPEEVSAIAPSQSATNEAPAEATAPQEPLSSQYAILARKEKALRQREQQLRAREAALKPAAPAEPAKPAFDESLYVKRDRLTQDPFTVLNELGLTYDQLTEMALNAPKPEQLAMQSELRALREEMKALRGETEKTLETSQKAQNDQALNLMRQEARKLVASDPNLEMIKITPGATNEIVKLIEDVYYKDGEFLSVEDAAQMVEDHLADEAMKYARAKKIQQRLQPKAETPTQKPNGAPQQQQLKTLTNSVTGSRPLSARERALLAFEGKLTK
jgi:hypothetical protein